MEKIMYYEEKQMIDHINQNANNIKAIISQVHSIWKRLCAGDEFPIGQIKTFMTASTGIVCLNHESISNELSKIGFNDIAIKFVTREMEPVLLKLPALHNLKEYIDSLKIVEESIVIDEELLAKIKEAYRYFPQNDGEVERATVARELCIALAELRAKEPFNRFTPEELLNTLPAIITYDGTGFFPSVAFVKGEIY